MKKVTMRKLRKVDRWMIEKLLLMNCLKEMTWLVQLYEFNMILIYVVFIKDSNNLCASLGLCIIIEIF